MSPVAAALRSCRKLQKVADNILHLWPQAACHSDTYTEMTRRLVAVIPAGTVWRMRSTVLYYDHLGMVLKKQLGAA